MIIKRNENGPVYYRGSPREIVSKMAHESHNGFGVRDYMRGVRKRCKMVYGKRISVITCGSFLKALAALKEISLSDES